MMEQDNNGGTGKPSLSPSLAKSFFFIAPAALVLATSTVAWLADRRATAPQDEAEVVALTVSVVFIVAHWTFILLLVQVYRALRKDSKGDTIYWGFRFDQLDWWMRLFIFVHPIGIGMSVLRSVGPCLQPIHVVLSFLMGALNGPIEEYFWRVLILQKAGSDALLSKSFRLVASSVMFSAWHVAWVYFNFPPHKVFRATLGSLGATLVFGIAWGLIAQKHRDNFFEVGLHHGLFNILAIFPAQFNSAFGACEAIPDFFS